MSLADEHETIWRTPHEQALMLLRDCDTDHPSVNTLRDRFGADGDVVYHQMRTAGHIPPDQPLATDARLTPSGRRLADHIALASAPGRPRWDDELARLVLAWLAETPHAGALGEFLADREPQLEVLGAVVSLDDVHRVGEWLREDELITAFPAWGGDVLRPEITRLGRAVLSSSTDMSIDAVLRRQRSGGTTVNDHRSYSATNHGVTGAMVQGDNAITTTEMSSITLQQREEAQRIVEDLLGSPEVAGSPAAMEKLEALQQELAKPDLDNKSLTHKVGAFLITAMTQGPAVIDGAQRIVQALGLC